MAPRFDDERCGWSSRWPTSSSASSSAASRFAHRGGYERMWLGQAIHSRYQEAPSPRPSYRREVGITR
jgi:hypothetical protein